MNRHLAHGCLILILAGAARSGLAAEPALQDRAPADVIRVWLSGGAVVRARVEAELRRRGIRMVHVVRAHVATASKADQRGLGRMASHLIEAYHRRHLPPGMVYIPAGPLEVPRSRAPWGPSGKRTHVPAFYLDRTEVTVGAWRQWLVTLDGVPARRGRRLPRPDTKTPADLPMVGITWAQAVRYAESARGGRLPRIEELERAVRGSGLSTWPWGSAWRANRALLLGERDAVPLPVGSYPHVRGPYGALDLVGNVAEWTADTRQAGRSPQARKALLFGGSYRDGPAAGLTWRNPRHAATLGGGRGSHVGFRVARAVPPIPPR